MPETVVNSGHKTRTYYFKRYTTNKCKSCPVKDQCTRAKYGKGVQRSEYQEQINRNKERIEQNQDYYRRQQAIVEHPYGTIKRQWGFSYVSTKKGKQRASADVGFMFIAYNLRRIMNIVGKNALKKYLEVLVLSISRIYCTMRFKISLLKAIKYLHKILTSYFEGCLNRLKFDQNLLKMEGF